LKSTNKKAMSRTSAISLIILIILVVALGFWLWPKSQTPPSVNHTEVIKQQPSHKFVGNVQSVNGSVITASGYFVADASGLPMQTNAVTVSISTTAATKFNKTQLIYPKTKVVTKPTPLNLEDASKKQVSADLADFSSVAQQIHGLDIVVTTQDNITGQSKFNASSINYVEDIYP
jgi:hypothetical protein